MPTVWAIQPTIYLDGFENNTFFVEKNGESRSRWIAGQVKQEPGASEEGRPSNGRLVSSGSLRRGAQLSDGPQGEVSERLL